MFFRRPRELNLRAKYRVENDAVVISSTIVNPTSTEYEWSFSSICKSNKDPHIAINGEIFSVISRSQQIEICAHALTTVYVSGYASLNLNDMRIPFSKLKDGENIIEVSYGINDGFVRNYEYESEAPQIATKAVSTEIKVTITK